MNFIKRALLSVWNRKGNTILLIIVFTVISTLIFGSLAIGSAVPREIDEIKNTTDTAVTYKYRNDKELGRIPFSQTEAVKAAAKNRYVKEANYYSTTDVYLTSIKPVGTKEDWEFIMSRLKSTIILSKQNGWEVGKLPSDAELMGDTDTSLDTFFTSGGYALVKGRYINKNDEGKNNIVINEKLADKNHLDIGSRLTLKSAPFMIDRHVKKTFTVVGIFKAPPMTTEHSEGFMNNPADRLFTSYTVPLSMDESDYAGNKLDSLYGGLNWVTYYLDKPEHIKAFESYLRSRLDMKHFALITDEKWYDMISGPLINMESMTKLISGITIASGCIIICLVLLFTVLERRRETGVLLALGEKKRHIAGQIFFEALVPAVIAFLIALALNGMVSAKAGDWLLAGNIKKQTPQYSRRIKSQLVKENGRSKDNMRMPYEELENRIPTLVGPKNDIKVELTPIDVMEFGGIEIILILLSVGVSSVIILRKSPVKLLSRKS